MKLREISRSVHSCDTGSNSPSPPFYEIILYFIYFSMNGIFDMES